MAAGTCWGTSGMVMRYLGTYGFDAVEIGALRLLVAAAAVSAAALHGKAGMRIRLRQVPWLVVMGAGGLFLFSLCYVLSVREVSLSLTAVLIYTSPMIVMLLSVWVFHEALTRRKWVALTLTFSGCSLAAGIFPAAVYYSWRGIGFALLAALLYALYGIMAKIQTRRSKALTVTAWSLIFGAAAALLVAGYPPWSAPYTSRTRVAYLDCGDRGGEYRTALLALHPGGQSGRSEPGGHDGLCGTRGGDAPGHDGISMKHRGCGPVWARCWSSLAWW